MVSKHRKVWSPHEDSKLSAYIPEPLAYTSSVQVGQIHIRIASLYQQLALPRWPCTEELQLHKAQAHRQEACRAALKNVLPAGSLLTAQLFWNKYFYNLQKKKKSAVQTLSGLLPVF